MAHQKVKIRYKPFTINKIKQNHTKSDQMNHEHK